MIIAIVDITTSDIQNSERNFNEKSGCVEFNIKWKIIITIQA